MPSPLCVQPLVQTGPLSCAVRSIRVMSETIERLPVWHLAAYQDEVVCWEARTGDWPLVQRLVGQWLRFGWTP